PLARTDLKPQNVLLDGAGHVKVCDFGLAKIMHRTMMSTRNVHAGTPAYMAPEQFEGSMISEKVDVYAFAMTMYECLTGVLPWSWLDGDVQVCRGIVRGRRPKLPGWTPPFLADLIKACWVGEPGDRPPFSHLVHWLQ
ncbi:hypothetical protein VOLCADRAFT_47122, partial [Volvox carteri f. nagariensis]